MLPSSKPLLDGGDVVVVVAGVVASVVVDGVAPVVAGNTAVGSWLVSDDRAS